MNSTTFPYIDSNTLLSSSGCRRCTFAHWYYYTIFCVAGIKYTPCPDMIVQNVFQDFDRSLEHSFLAKTMLICNSKFSIYLDKSKTHNIFEMYRKSLNHLKTIKPNEIWYIHKTSCKVVSMANSSFVSSASVIIPWLLEKRLMGIFFTLDVIISIVVTQIKK